MGTIALAYLLTLHYDATHNLVPQEFKLRIRMELNKVVSAGVSGVNCSAPNYNPIRQAPVIVTGDQGCVYIVDVIPSCFVALAGARVEQVGW